MTFEQAMEAWEGFRGTRHGAMILDTMKKEGRTTATPEGKSRFTELVEQMIYQRAMGG